MNIHILCKCPRVKKILDDLKKYYDDIKDTQIKKEMYGYIYEYGINSYLPLSEEIDAFNVMYKAYVEKRMKSGSLLKLKIEEISLISKKIIEKIEKMKNKKIRR